MPAVPPRRHDAPPGDLFGDRAPVVAQIEVGIGVLPGGGATERLPRLIGRGRALEAILSANDYSAER